MATKEQYEALLKDRPKKFSEKEVNYHEAKPSEPNCAGCMHYFISAVRQIQTCEIMRPKSESVEPNYVCEFYSRDGENFPLFSE